MSYDPAEMKARALRKLPGNDGGETYRQYCGLTLHRRRRTDGSYLDRGVTAQTLFRAIGRHS